jgi:hypothetical protein
MFFWRRNEKKKNYEEKGQNTGNRGEIVVCKSEDGLVKLDVRLENETVWLTRQKMAELFQTTIPNISMHIKNIYIIGELTQKATVKDFLTVQNEGNRDVSRNIESRRNPPTPGRRSQGCYGGGGSVGGNDKIFSGGNRIYCNFR